MGVLIESGEDNLPEDVAALDDELRLEYKTAIEKAPKISTVPKNFNLIDAGKQLADTAKSDQEALLRPIVEPIVAPKLKLERWLVEARAYQNQGAANVGILGRLFSGEAKAVNGGVIHNARRFSVVPAPGGRLTEVGVSVRLSVATTSYDAKLSLTLPKLAAKAELSNWDTRIGITVVGYSGFLGDLLPAPKRLDVDTCIQYVEAFKQIQQLIFSEEGSNWIAPTILSYDETIVSH